MDAFRSLGTHMSRPNEINWPSNLPMMTLLEEQQKEDCKSYNKYLFEGPFTKYWSQDIMTRDHPQMMSLSLLRKGVKNFVTIKLKH